MRCRPNRRVLDFGTYNGHPPLTSPLGGDRDRLAENDEVVIYRGSEQLGARLQIRSRGNPREEGDQGVVSRIGSALCTCFCDSVPADWYRISGEAALIPGSPPLISPRAYRNF